MLKKRLLIIALVVGGVLATAGVVWNTTGFGSATQAASKEYAQWKANGLPSRKEEIFTEPPPALSDNAFLDLKRAIAEYRSLGRPGSLDGLGRNSDDYKTGRISAHIAKMQPVLAYVHKAVEKDRLCIEREWDMGGSVILPELSEFRQFTYALAWDAEQKAGRGDWKGAVRSLRAGRKLNRLAAQDACTLAARFALMSDALMLQSAGRCASWLSLDAQALEAMKAVSEEDWQFDPDLALRGDAFIVLATFRNIDDAGILSLSTEGRFVESAIVPPTRDGLPASVLSRAAAAEAMTFWNDFYPRLRESGADLRKLAEEMDARDSAGERSRSQPLRAAHAVIGGYGQFFRHADRRRSDQEAFRSFLAALQHLIKHGQPPATLAEARTSASDYQLDEPVRYRSEGKGFRIWHSGRNGIDDGGFASDEARAHSLDSSQIDDVFRHPWPKR